MSKVELKGYMEEAERPFNLRTALDEANRCLVCYDAPCSKACPAGTDPARFIRALKFRNVKGGIETIRENNPLGGICAKVCPYDQLCQGACSMTGIDKPIRIGKIQSFLIEQEEAFKMHVVKAPAEKKEGKVACIGAGPASLTCARELAKAGYSVTIFEREQRAGGMASYGIVPSRLPQKVVDHDIQLIADLGVQFVFGHEVKREDLEPFDAVFVGTGLWDAKIPSIEGAGLPGVYSAVDYLKKAGTEKEAFHAGKTVIVVGLGDVAVDCATTAKLLGAEDVRIMYRRTIEEAPADMDELKYALSLGVGITTGFYPVSAKGNGKLEIVEAAGFRDKEAKMTLSADTLVFATGQKAEKLDILDDLPISGKGTIEAQENGFVSGKVFAAGDVVNGGQTVVQAVADAKLTAAEIIAYLEKKGV